jgi:hypothetical protein
MATSQFRLKVQKLDKVCLFELSWGQGQQLTAMLSYPPMLTERYQEWQRLYLSFYKTAQTLLSPSVNTLEKNLRGRLVKSANLNEPPVDWHTKLIEAQVKLLTEFHRWLRSAELFEIRAAIARTSRTATEATPHAVHHSVDVFLTCTPTELARFPWEAWEISADFAAAGTIRVVRTPANVYTESAQRGHSRRGRTRILAIMGDDTGLNFQVDMDAVRSLSRIAEVKFVGWQPGQTADQVKTQISQAILDEQGWDVLFFAGHSNEMQAVGGELAIAPNISIPVCEIAPQLTTAINRGLQFAIFNSCSGLDIAESLIGIGFSQVAIMREPIHNRVAQEFLVQFLRNLAEYKDVNESLLATCQFLKLEKNLTYPSAYLIPSLFCHPGAELFRIKQSDWKRQLLKIVPTRLEAIALVTCLTLGLIPQVQDFLLDRRILVQSFYRHITGQIPDTKVPPVVLVQIDKASIQRDQRLENPTPISQSYLADLVERLSGLSARVIGFDYYLDRSDQDSDALRQSLKASVTQQNTWFVFGTLFDEADAGTFTPEAPGIAEPNWSMQSYMEAFPNRVMLPYPEEDCSQTCPFAYLLAFVRATNQDAVNRSRPQLDSSRDLQAQLLSCVDKNLPRENTLTHLQQLHFTPIADWSYQVLGLTWLHPVIDFSIPPDQIYQRVAAWRVLEQPLEFPCMTQQIVIIASGGYEEAGGIIEGQVDYYDVPAAVQYWRNHLPSQNNAAMFPNGNSANSPTYLPVFTGGEIHSYSVHHLLNQRLVVPVPDVWMVGLAGLLGKSIVLRLKRQQRLQWTRRRQIQSISGFATATILYSLISLQLYISAAILLPGLLPLSTFWVYILPTLRKKFHV